MIFNHDGFHETDDRVLRGINPKTLTGEHVGSRYPAYPLIPVIKTVILGEINYEMNGKHYFDLQLFGLRITFRIPRVTQTCFQTLWFRGGPFPAVAVHGFAVKFENTGNGNYVLPWILQFSSH